jgi:hypothetical protein
MVVHNLDVFRAVVDPVEANTPLSVDANAVLARAIPFQHFQPVARRFAQVLDPNRRVEQQEFDPRSPGDVRRKLPRRLVIRTRSGYRGSGMSGSLFHTTGIREYCQSTDRSGFCIRLLEQRLARVESKLDALVRLVSGQWGRG